MSIESEVLQELRAQRELLERALVQQERLIAQQERATAAMERLAQITAGGNAMRVEGLG